MTPPLDTIAIIPLMLANLCAEPGCSVVTNQTLCPVCGSQTLVLSCVLSEKKKTS
jgi:hypothetical protein